MRWRDGAGALGLGLAALLVGGCQGGSSSGSAQAALGEGTEWERIDVQLHLNEEEQELQVHLGVYTSEEVREVTLTDPNGRVVLEQRVGAGAAAGVDEVCAQALVDGAGAFPEGTYRVDALTMQGIPMVGFVDLVYDLMSAPEIPDGPEEPIDPDDVTIEWGPVAEAAGYAVEIETDERVVMRATLPPGITSFPVPPGLLDGETEYEVVVQTISPSGHVTEAETTIETAAR